MEQLPLAYLQRMESLLGEEYRSFVDAYRLPRTYGLRINTLKANIEDIRRKLPFSLDPIPWTAAGYYYPEAQHPGKHPYHAAGVYYIQEPSAMAVVEALDIQPGEKVLDLCGAPGGKATQAGALLQGKGLLLANEINGGRAKILSENIERLGITNAVVASEDPIRLEKRFPSFFDKIIVDAPCSGEGMFRKDPMVCQEWKDSSCAVCAGRQKDIMRSAASMLKPGGRMVYSTCTFSPEENEGIIAWFLDNHPEYRVIPSRLKDFFAPGRPEWANGSESLADTMRLWPHKMRGEGHFIAVLERTAGDETKVSTGAEGKEPKEFKTFLDFSKVYLKEIPIDRYIHFGNELYSLPRDMVPLDGLKVIRPGWHLGTLKKNRFEPSHALAMALHKEQVLQSVNFSAESQEALHYLKGGTLTVNMDKGWTLVLIDGFSAGWGKIADGVLKNHYPKGLRWN